MGEVTEGSMVTTMRQICRTVALCALLSACVTSDDVVNSTAYDQGGPFRGPESLLRTTDSVASIPLDSDRGVEDVVYWAGQASRPVELQCTQGSARCGQAEKALKRRGAPFVRQSSPDGQDRALVFMTRVEEKTCDPSYLDSAHNETNQSSPHFGCSASTNMLRMIRDKRQIIAPAQVGNADGEQAVKTVRTYQSEAGTSGDSGGSESALQELSF